MEEEIVMYKVNKINLKHNHGLKLSKINAKIMAWTLCILHLGKCWGEDHSLVFFVAIVVVVICLFMCKL
jgi:hypothetical protein